MREDRRTTGRGGKSAEVGLAGAIAALGTEGFATALEGWLHAALSFDNITVLAYFRQGRPQLLYCAADLAQVHARLDSAYLNGAYLLDPFHQLHLDAAPDGLYHLSAIAPDHFTRGEYYLTYYAATTLIDEATYVASLPGGAHVTLCLGRDASSGRRFSGRDLADAERIAPVVLALMRQHWQEIATEETPEGAVGEGLAEQLRARTLARLGIALTGRQSETAVLILKGHSTGSIALKLGLSPATVKVFRKQLYQRCGISSQAELFSLLLPLLGAPETR